MIKNLPFGLLSKLYLQIFVVLALISIYPRISAADVFAQGLPVAAPQTVGMNAAKLNQIDALVEADIKDKKLPGAVVLVGHKGKIVFRKAYGNRSLVPTVEPMTVDTIFDLASLTKVVATTTSIMILVEQGKLRLNDTIGTFIPDIDDDQVKRVTIQQLLTHTSGFAPDFDLKEKWTGRDGMLGALKKEKLRTPPGAKFVYSDINFITLAEILDRVSRRPIGIFEYQYLSAPLGIRETVFADQFFCKNSTAVRTNDISVNAGYNYAAFKYCSDRKRIAPTENIRGQNSYLGSTFEGDDKTGSEILRGVVHDPTAYRMDGVAGHAGLFSTADDLARFCQMLLSGGVAPVGTGRRSDRVHKRILSAQTIARMTAPIVVSETGETRGLGWDINSAFSSNRGELFPLGSFGHTGFTGTSLWIDPTSQTFVVFLSNRVHPDGKGDVTPLRAKIATVVASAIEDTPIEKWKEAEARYNSAVAAQIPKFREQAEMGRRSTGVQASLPASGGTPLRGVAGRIPALQSVLNGIDILKRDKFKPLDGLKIGLVTNQTGRDLAGKPTVDILKEAPNVKLVALFSPEHGIRGDLDQDTISDSIDEKTGLPIYSLQNEKRRPAPDQLKDLDAVVYDIQDIGSLYYTYIAILRNVMEEAAKLGKPVYVLDRPNPINGEIVEGPTPDPDKVTYVIPHVLGLRHGMTIGELAVMLNAERKIGADLHVIRMEGWRRSMWFDETGQTFFPPSPNIRSLTEATLYSGINLPQFTNLSVGRGTDTPFEVIGAPWLDGRKLAAYLNEREIPGVRFIPVRFTPSMWTFKGEECGGVNIVILDRNAFRTARTGIEIIVALRKLYPVQWNIKNLMTLVGNQRIFYMISRGDSPEDIEKVVRPMIDDFMKRRAPFLLYK